MIENYLMIIFYFYFSGKTSFTKSDSAYESKTIVYYIYLTILKSHYLGDEFELDFSGSSEPELWKFQAEPSRAGAL